MSDRPHSDPPPDGVGEDIAQQYQEIMDAVEELMPGFLVMVERCQEICEMYNRIQKALHPPPQYVTWASSGTNGVTIDQHHLEDD